MKKVNQASAKKCEFIAGVSAVSVPVLDTLMAAGIGGKLEMR